jgi:histidinol-phosphate aminotransferase
MGLPKDRTRRWNTAMSRHIQSIEPYKPGKPLEELERELGIKNAIKLASNENPLGPSKKAMRVLSKGLPSLHRYPEGTGRILREALAPKYKLHPEQIILGNGSDEIMDLAAKTFLSPGDEALIGDRTFAIYSICIRAHHGTVVSVPLREGRYDLEAMGRRLSPRTRLVFICNPNNPTGAMVTQKELEGFMTKLPEGALVVMDEAYGEYADDPQFPDTVALLKSGAPLLVLRTFSKLYGLAGLRIGYGLSRPEVISLLNRTRLPFNTNTLAQYAAVAALRDEAHVSRSLAINHAGKTYLYRAFEAMGLRFLPTQANFIYLNVGRDGGAVYQALLRLGVIVRVIEGSWLRISIGLASENRRFIAALKKTLK